MAFGNMNQESGEIEPVKDEVAVAKPYTDEQRAGIESAAEVLVVDAFAGTGKTTLLDGYARARPKEAMLYIAFNKGIQMEAARRFPGTVHCVTTHGLAYSAVGKRYAKKLGSPRAQSLAAMAEFRQFSHITLSKSLDTINNFLCSRQPCIDENHINQSGASKNNAQEIYDVANRIWARMQSPFDMEVSMPHDGYLKLYQLAKPILPYRRILLDEAQDSNPVTLELLNYQTSGLVVVGDEHQAIYQFRKACNAMSKVRADERIALTNSFRFGAGVASLATSLLKDFREEKRAITGLGKHRDTKFGVNRFKQPYTFIARTNGLLFEEAMFAIREGVPFAYLGGVSGYRLDSIADVAHLAMMNKHLIADPAIRPFGNLGDMKTFAESTDDKELKMFIRVYEDNINKGWAPDGIKSEGPMRVIGLVDYIKRHAQAAIPRGSHGITLVTGHKAKGLEFDSVVLGNDFTSDIIIPNDYSEWERPDAEEINILYVALTRAERAIQLNPTMVDWLEQRGGLHAKEHKVIAEHAPGAKMRAVIEQAKASNASFTLPSL